MKALTYTKPGRFELIEKPKLEIIDPKDAVVRVTLSSICSSDLHILHGAVPQAEVGITVGHELVGVVEAVGSEVTKVKPGDRVAVNVETFCGECFYCKRGYVNNCTSGGWMLGCHIDGGQAEYVRVPYADNGLTPIPENVSDERCLSATFSLQAIGQPRFLKFPRKIRCLSSEPVLQGYALSNVCNCISLKE